MDVLDQDPPMTARTGGQSSPPTRGRPRMIVRLLAVVVLMLGTSIVVAPAASAYPSWYRPNGCSAPQFLDNNVSAFFRSACNTHDVCYDWVENRNGNAGRLRCDNRFKDNMIALCDRGTPAGILRLGCWEWAWTYYGAVRAFGGPYFNNPYKN